MEKWWAETPAICTPVGVIPLAAIHISTLCLSITIEYTPTLQCPSTLYLSTILGASVPPAPFRKGSVPLLLNYTNSFLDEVETARAADSSLIPFDPG